MQWYTRRIEALTHQSGRRAWHFTMSSIGRQVSACTPWPARAAAAAHDPGTPRQQAPTRPFTPQLHSVKHTACADVSVLWCKCYATESPGSEAGGQLALRRHSRRDERLSGACGGWVVGYGDLDFQHSKSGQRQAFESSCVNTPTVAGVCRVLPAVRHPLRQLLQGEYPRL
jgi:hypothetical protein